MAINECVLLPLANVHCLSGINKNSLHSHINILPIPGIPVVSFGEITITSMLNVFPPTFNVTCLSVDGPVTSVAWTVDGSPVPSENNPITTRTLNDTITGAYILTLSVTGRLTGTYQCTVTSLRPNDDSVPPGMYVTSAVSGEYNGE